jgi:hypothetical protein
VAFTKHLSRALIQSRIFFAAYKAQRADLSATC